MRLSGKYKRFPSLRRSNRLSFCRDDAMSQITASHMIEIAGSGNLAGIVLLMKMSKAIVRLMRISYQTAISTLAPHFPRSLV